VLHAALAVAGSVIAVSMPVLGAVLVATALLLTLLDAGGVLLTTRRLFGRRATQNVVSREDASERPAGAPVQAAKPGTLVLVAHSDSPRQGIAHGQRRRLPVLVGAMSAVLVCCLLRAAAGVEGAPITVIQFVLTVATIGCAGLYLDSALARPAPADDTGAALAFALAARHGGRLRDFDLWVVVTGAQTAGAHGMRAFLRRHSAELPRDSTVVVNLEGARAGVWFTRREGALLTLRSHPQLVQICREIAEDASDRPARAFVNRNRSDGAAASGAGYPAITVMGAEEAAPFCDELIRRIDASLLSGRPA
jgi:hypothetical protein